MVMPARARVRWGQTVDSGGVFAQRCPACETPREGWDRYCGVCGHDFEMQQQPVASNGNGLGLNCGHPSDGAQIEGWHDSGWVLRCRSCQQTTLGHLVLRVGSAGMNGFSQPAAERMFLLWNRTLVFGRDPSSADVAIPDDTYVSRRQLEVFWTGSAWALRDLDSSNGTVVNGALLKEWQIHPLKPGDVIEIGHRTRIKVDAVIGTSGR
ncbi:MAG: FHA domain-containing protein [Candidatus Dormibacteraeota bacterium]|nr:FHA domain-containing protein [Candidatus Dormibacteraeota bacterium]